MPKKKKGSKKINVIEEKILPSQSNIQMVINEIPPINTPNVVNVNVPSGEQNILEFFPKTETKKAKKSKIKVKTIKEKKSKKSKKQKKSKKKKKDITKQDNFTNAISRINSKSLKLSKDVKNTKNYIAYDPTTKQIIYGNQTEISKKLKTTPPTIKKRFTSGNQQFKPIKGFQLLKFNNAEDAIQFKNKIEQGNKKVKEVKVEKKPKEQPKENYKVKDLGVLESDKYPLGKHHFKVDILSDALSYGDIENAISEFTSQAIKARKLKDSDLIRIIVEDPNLKHMVSHNFIELRKWNPTLILKKIAEVVESNEDYRISSQTSFVVESVNMVFNQYALKDD